MDYLSLIKRPIEAELSDFIALFEKSLDGGDGMLRKVLNYIGARSGKRMRPMLMLLMAKNFGKVTDATLNAAVGLELLHTASIVHDDVVDESGERRGQASVNADFGNKVAVLAGDYLLSTALLHVSYTHSERIVRYLSELGQTLSNGEILQLTNTQTEKISEEVYYEVIKKKTAALFEACSVMGAESAGDTDEDDIQAAREFGQNLGIIFQIRDDIFDYYESKEIGKPTGNDMAEGKLTLPVIYAVNTFGDDKMVALARKVKSRNVSAEEIAKLVDFTKRNGGIEYAEKRMNDFRDKVLEFIDKKVSDESIKNALTAYVDFFINRKY
ncbi:MAG: polyprenyl synthetase family protein [Prevotella sp.]|jgi:octaprenyl-diphosphate synthase|nr:polyprenyl synthetase family protein [Prevotella sp.]